MAADIIEARPTPVPGEAALAARWVVSGAGALGRKSAHVNLKIESKPGPSSPAINLSNQRARENVSGNGLKRHRRRARKS